MLTINGNTLTSGDNTIAAIGNTGSTPNPGSEQFGIRITATGGNGTVSAPYNNSVFALDQTNFPDEVASSASASDNTIYAIRYLANISDSTGTGIYSASLIFTATPSF